MIKMVQDLNLTCESRRQIRTFPYPVLKTYSRGLTGQRHYADRFLLVLPTSSDGNVLDVSHPIALPRRNAIIHFILSFGIIN